MPDPLEIRLGWFEEVTITEVDGLLRAIVTIPSVSKGRLRRLPLWRLLYFLSVEHRSGTLTLREKRLHRKLSFRSGEFLLGQPHTMEEVLPAFLWKDGRYLFDHSDTPKGLPADLAHFIHLGFKRMVGFNELASHFALFTEWYPVATSRAKPIVNQWRGGPLHEITEVLALCDGSTTISQQILRATLPPLKVLRGLASGLTLDLIALSSKPTSSKLGVSYRLAAELAPAEDLGRTLASQSLTVQRIKRLGEAEKAVLQQLKAKRDHYANASPYDILELSPGCGDWEAQRAFFAKMVDHTHQGYDQSVHTPLKVVSALVARSLKDAYLLVRSLEEPSESVSPEESSAQQLSQDDLELRLSKVNWIDYAEEEEDFEKARRYLERARGLNLNSVTIIIASALLEVRAGDMRAARTHLGVAMTRDPGHPDLRRIQKAVEEAVVKRST